MSKTAQEILEVIKANMDESDFAYGDFNSVELGLGECEEIAQYGGEGKGDAWYSVKYFKDHNVYIRIDGCYTSYDGTDFYDGYGTEVFPKEKTITVYE